jgi:hypothetical protein
MTLLVIGTATAIAIATMTMTIDKECLQSTSTVRNCSSGQWCNAGCTVLHLGLSDCDDTSKYTTVMHTTAPTRKHYMPRSYEHYCESTIVYRFNGFGTSSS